jgi:hypothetical protein
MEQQEMIAGIIAALAAVIIATGTSTTNSTGTTFYGPGGNVTGKAVAPSRR